MAWVATDPIYTAETQDRAAEGMTAYSRVPLVDVPQIDSTRSQTGARCFRMPSGATNLLATATATGGGASFTSLEKLAAFSGAWGLSAAPTVEHPILRESLSSRRYVRIGTDRKIRIYNAAGTQRGDPSTTLIPTAGLQEMHVFFDGLTLSTVWVHVYFGATLELSFDTGDSWATFMGTSEPKLFIGSVTDSEIGLNIFFDDAIVRRSSAAGDAPHLAQYPRLRGNGALQQNADANGTYTAWTNDYTGIDETGGHDGDTSYVEGIRSGELSTIKETFKSSVANPVPVGATVVKAQQRAVIRETDASKLGCFFMHKIGANEVDNDPNDPGTTSYVGMAHLNLARPGGGSWARADFDPNNLEFGVRTRQSGDPNIDSGSRVTLMPNVEVLYYIDLLPLATAPSAVQRRRGGVV